MMLTFYICNGKKPCRDAEDGCKNDYCDHTCDAHFAKNKESVEIFEAFNKRFDIHLDEDGDIIITEKLKEDV